ncbi:lytic transglycosylase domain-containing protein [Luteibacter aegosomatissinici]|uniref:lytic transglycosylase domain-containing protein n=1 Tax=Luteibacter aegosomatissinici TaxID=2911539 RepID=UPI003CCDE50D
MMGCQNLAVPAEVMQHVVNVESSRNPFAIGVVGGQLVRQPQNLPEAVATVRMLEDKGYNYSLGVAQVNRSNLGKFGLDTPEKAFALCPNLSAGSKILAQCYASANKDWGKAFSCYYSGNFTTGYQHGYVQRVFASMAKSGMIAGARAIPVVASQPVKVVGADGKVKTISADGDAYRIAMRSVADSALAAAIGPAVAQAAGQPAYGQGAGDLQTAQAVQAAQAAMQAQQAQGGQYAYPAGAYGANQGIPGAMPITNPALTSTPQPLPGPIPTDPATAALMQQIGAQLPQGNVPTAGRIRTDPGTAAVMSQIGVSAASPAGNQAAPGPNDVFVPQVTGPNDPPPQAQPAAPVQPQRDNADLRNGTKDDAFVF